MTKPPSRPDPDDEDALIELQEDFGASVRAARKKLGLRQKDLGEKCGMAQTEISRIEKGQINMTLRIMSRLANVLEGDVAKMLQASRNRLKHDRGQGS